MRLQNLFAALSCWFMAAGALVAWWWPQFLDAGSWVGNLGAIALIEFLAIHSAGMLAGILITPQGEPQRAASGRQKRLLRAAMIGLVGFYLLLAYGVATEIKSTSLFLGFLALMLSRAMGFFGMVDRHELMRDLYRTFFGLGLFFVGLLMIWLIPFPAGAVEGQRVGGMPAESVFGAFVIYFLLLGFFEYKVPHKLPDRFM